MSLSFSSSLSTCELDLELELGIQCVHVQGFQAMLTRSFLYGKQETKQLVSIFWLMKE